MIIKNILIHWETTASSKLTVAYIELKDNNVNVIIKRDVSKIVEDSLKDYFFMIEVQQEANCDYVTYAIK